MRIPTDLDNADYLRLALSVKCRSMNYLYLAILFPAFTNWISPYIPPCGVWPILRFSINLVGMALFGVGLAGFLYHELLLHRLVKNRPKLFKEI